MKASRSARHSLAAVAACLVLSACGSNPSSELHASQGAGSASKTTEASEEVAGWVARGSNLIIYVRWTRQGAGVAGFLQQVSASGKDTDPLSTMNRSFEGTITGTGVSLTFRTLGMVETWTGTVRAGRLSLDIPSSDGTISTDTFVPATNALFNGEVEVLRARLLSEAHARAEQLARETEAARQAQVVLDQEATESPGE